MENSVAPEGLDITIAIGDVEAVRAWLDAGGDVNAKCPYSRFSSWRSYRTPLGSLLIVAARCCKTSIMDLLLTRGADIDATDAEGSTALYEMLNYWMTYGSLPALRLLLSRGADVNLAKQSGFMVGHTPLMTAVSFGPDVVRMLLRAGADPEHRTRDLAGGNSTAEEQCRSDRYSLRCSASADLLRDIRLAGGWKRYVLQPKYDLLVLRALCHRDRATLSARTPEVLVRLFGAPDGRRRTRSTRATEGVHVHLPDPLFWRVLDFALGPVYDYPWVRERVRARAAAAAAAAAAAD